MIKDDPQTTSTVTAWQIACLFTLVISALAYLPAMSGLAIWDDHALIGGTGIGGGKSLTACFTEPFLLHYFRPLVSASFFIDHKLFGSGPFFYHQTNMLIHMLTTLFCLGLLRAAFRNRIVPANPQSRRSGCGASGTNSGSCWKVTDYQPEIVAVAGSLAFALQPAQVSTVAWIGGRTDSLCTLWVALFAWALIRSAQAHGAARAKWTAVSTLSFVLALLTKEQVLGLLPLVPLAFRCFAATTPRAAWRAGLWYWVPYVISGVAFVAAWCAFYPSPFRPVMHSLPEQAVLAGRTLTYYTGLLVVPTPCAMHLLSVGTLEHFGFWSVIPGYAALAVLLCLCVRGIRRYPACAWFCAFVLVAILPVSNMIPLPSLVVAPYRAGVCGLGAAALLGYVLTWGFRQLMTVAEASVRNAPVEAATLHLNIQTAPRPVRGRKTAAWVQLAAASLFLFWCGALTWWGAGQWHDERTIFATVVRYDPDSIVARFNLTTALLKEHHTKPALIELDALMTRLFRSGAWKNKEAARAALHNDPKILERIRENQGNAIRPENWLAALYAQMGFAQLNIKDRAAARRSFTIGRAIDRTNDDINLGMAQMAYDAGSYRIASGYLRVVLAARPRRAEAHMLMGHALAAMGRWREARGELKAWAEIQSWNGQAYTEIAQANCRLGDYSSARANLEFALGHAICDVQEVRARLRNLHGRAAQFLN